MRVTQGLRNKGNRPRRTKSLEIDMTDEELDAIFSAAGYTGQFAATWARDVLLSRAGALFKQRMLS